MDDDERTAAEAARPGEPKGAAAWLAAHGLTDVPPTPLLATRLAVRQRARLSSSLLLAAFIIAVAVIYGFTRPSTAVDESGAYRHWSLLAVAAAVGGLVLAQSLLDWKVRRADRRAAATLPRRAAHPVRPGWRSVLGLPRAVFAVATFGGAIALATASLTLRDASAQYAALVLLIGLCGAAAGTAVQLRHVLTHPVVADDEASLTADGIMRTDDARDATTPSLVWCLPAASVLDAVPDAWVVAWCVFIALSASALALITVLTGLAARRRGTPLAPPANR